MEEEAGSSRHTADDLQQNIFADTRLPLHETGGARRTMRGFNFQFELTMLWLLRAVKGDNDFEVCTEDERAGKFDEFCFTEKSPEGNIVAQRFVQIKSSLREEGKITFNELIGRGRSKIKLTDYFRSFVKVNRNFSDMDGDKKFILYTCKQLDMKSTFRREENGETIMLENALAGGASFYDPLFNVNICQFNAHFPGKQILVEQLLEGTDFKKADVEEFLQHFWFAIDATDHKVNELVRTELKKNYVRDIDLDSVYNQYFTELQSWYLLKKGTILSKEIVSRYFHSIRDKISRKQNFGLLKSTNTFFTRTDILEDMKRILIDGEKKHNIDLIITGTAGVGKTELARKFANIHNERFQHVLWINAESQTSLEHSFSLAAQYFGLNTNEPSNVIVSEHILYDYLKNRNCLIIFDNAQLNVLKNSQMLLLQLKTNIRVLITSQERYMDCGSEVNLDVFSVEESQEFLSKYLSIHEDADCFELANLLSGLPLELQLVVSLITIAKRKRKVLGQEYEVEEFIEEYRKTNSILSHTLASSSLERYDCSLGVTWNMAISKILTDDVGHLAVTVLSCLAYMEPNNILIDGFEVICEKRLGDVFSLLDSHSLVKVEQGSCSIHRLIQRVLRSKLHETHELEGMPLILQFGEADVLKNCCDVMFSCITRYRIQDKYSIHAHFFKVWSYVKEYSSIKATFLDNRNVTRYISALSDFEWYIIGYNKEFIDVIQCLLNHNLEKNQPFVYTHDTLRWAFILALVLRKYRMFDIVPVHLAAFLNFESLDLKCVDCKTCIKLVSEISFSYFKMQKFSAANELWDQFEQLACVQFGRKSLVTCDVSIQKCMMLIWQRQHECAAERFETLIKYLIHAEPFYTFVYLETDIGVCYFNNILVQYDDVFVTKRILTPLFRTLYASKGYKACMDTLLFIFHNSSRLLTIDSKHIIGLLKLMIETASVSGDIAKQVDISANLLDCLVESDYIYDPVILLENRTIWTNLSKLNASFRPGVLNSLINELETIVSSLNVFVTKSQIETHAEQLSTLRKIIPEIVMSTGRLKFQNGDFFGAVSTLNDLKENLLNGIQDAYALCNINCELATIQNAIGKFYDAHKTLRDASLHSHSVTFLLDLCEIELYFTIGNLQQAEELTRVYLIRHATQEIPPQNKIQVLYHLFKLHLKYGKYERAMETNVLFQKQISFDKNYDHICADIYRERVKFLEKNYRLYPPYVKSLFLRSQYDRLIRTAYCSLVLFNNDSFCRSASDLELFVRMKSAMTDKLNNDHCFISSANKTLFGIDTDTYRTRISVVYCLIRLKRFTDAFNEIDDMKNDLACEIDKSEEYWDLKDDINRLHWLVSYEKIHSRHNVTLVGEADNRVGSEVD